MEKGEKGKGGGKEERGICVMAWGVDTLKSRPHGHF